MSDDDDDSLDSPDAAPAAVSEVSTMFPEFSKRLSEQESRTLIITFVGGLAANVGTVLLVGTALAFVHVHRSTHRLGGLLWLSLALFVVGPASSSLPDTSMGGIATRVPLADACCSTCPRTNGNCLK
jgi:hypothetical protein